MEGSCSAISSDVDLAAGPNLATFMQRGGHTGGSTGLGLHKINHLQITYEP